MSIKQHIYEILRPGDLVEISSDFYYPERHGVYYGLVLLTVLDLDQLLVYHFKNGQTYHTSHWFIGFNIKWKYERK